ncbi:hypothetical protein NM688_g6134 [Phlebia brevispora]|uniref:Uncharacterized protein n=1 Tax=Phlebia brevispora TaxID=194682 RepID=A0ACC1SJL4_9APHY|nr:hypothetical protein NM688_g6134 [Phlebia brevispora]
MTRLVPGQKTVTLQDLPDEMLLEIMNWLASARRLPKRGEVISKMFDVFYVLSQVNRRFRALAIPFIRRYLEFTDREEFNKVMEEFKTNVNDWAHLVRHIVPPADEVLPTSEIEDPEFTLDVGYFVFPNLITFECLLGLFTPAEMRLLTAASSQKLKELTISWHDRHGFVSQSSLPQLDTLRLYLKDPPSLHPINEPFRQPTPLAPYTSITRLMLHETTYDASKFVQYYLEKAHFPNLRVLNLQEVMTSGNRTFDFIQRHPTLLEVNVSIDSVRVRFESVHKLIEGTGTWCLPTNGAIETVDIDQASYEETDIEDPRPPFIPDTWLLTHDFAFRRKPLKADSTQWQSSCGSKHPRYTTTALAFHVEDQSFWTTAGLECRALVPDIISLLADLYPELEELSVSTDTWQPDEHRPSVFTSFMEALGQHLREFRHLRSFCIRWPLSTNCVGGWFSWTGDDTGKHRNWPCCSIDCAVPPMGFCIADMRHQTEYQQKEEIDAVKDVIRSLGVLGPDEPIDEKDNQLLMHAWRAHGESIVARAMRDLAEQCPLLEQIQWYAVGELWDLCVRWEWRIVRSEDGSIRTLTNDLNWHGSIRGDPVPLVMLVGEEMENMRQTE